MKKTTAGVRRIRIGSLPATSGSGKRRKRVGRGPGSGHGKTSTRGHKGQLSRSGSKHRSWFEGGQMPLQRRVPKRGFTNVFRKEYQIVNLSALSRVLEKSEASAENVISPQRMRETGLISKADLPVKILGDGEMKGNALVQANAFSQKAKEKIEAAGGKVEVIKC